jgi:hypothetical protein
MTLSQIAFARGAQNGVEIGLMPMCRTARSNWSPNLASLSWIKNLGQTPKGVASLITCMHHCVVGESVAAICLSSRVAWAMITIT